MTLLNKIISISLASVLFSAAHAEEPKLSAKCQKNLVCTTMKKLNEHLEDEGDQYNRAPSILVFANGIFKVTVASGDFDVESCKIQAPLVKNDSGEYDCPVATVSGECWGGGVDHSAQQDSQPYTGCDR